MSDAAGEKKKGGKLPIIIGLVVLLAGGGYFGLKGGKKEEKPKKEPPKLGAVMDLGEFTVNLKGNNGANYVRAKVSVHCDPTIDAAHGAESYAAPLQDVVITVMSDYTLQDLLTAEGKAELRRRLAYEMNHRMHLIHPHEGEDEEEESKDEEKEKDSDAKDNEDHASDHKGESHGSGHGAPWLKEPEWPELDSDKGPILKIYLTDFAMQ